jgi:hypothetical protein
LRKIDDFWIFVLVLKTFVGFPISWLFCLFYQFVPMNVLEMQYVCSTTYMQHGWLALFEQHEKWLSTFSRHLNSSWPERKTFLREAF